MGNLLDFPAEVLQAIFSSLITQRGLKVAVKARLVCRVFDAELLSAVWATRALEGPDRPRSPVGERMMTEYLLARTLADHAQSHHLTTAIHETLECMTRMTTTALPPKQDLIREACLAAARSGMSQSTDPTHTLLRSWNGSARSANALALAAHCNMPSLLQALVEAGVRNDETYFGNAFLCAAGHADSSMITVYLNAKLKVLQKGDQHNTSHLARRDPNRIANYEYEKAIRHAAKSGTTERLVLLTRAAEADGALGPRYSSSSDDFPSFNHCPNRVQWLILVVAARCGRLDIVQFALDNGAPLELPIWYYQSPLQAAAYFGQTAIVQFLLARGANPDQGPDYDPSPLVYAIRGGHIDVIKIFLHLGLRKFSPLQRDTNHPLVEAVRSKRPEVLRLLIDNGFTFLGGSQLGKDLSGFAAIVGDREIQALLTQARR